MVKKYISKENLKRLLGQLAEQENLAAPVRVNGEVLLQQVDSAKEIVFDYENTLNAPKDYLLLNDEVLFSYKVSGKTVSVIASPEGTKQSPYGEASHSHRGRLHSNARNDDDFPELVIFGARPCDTAAVQLLDKFFARNFEDPIYLKKRSQILIITVTCPQIGPDCFCNSTGSGPYLDQNFDIQLVDIGGGYLLEASSARGREFVKKISRWISASSVDKRRKKEQALKKAAGSKKPDFNLQQVYRSLDKFKPGNEFWRDLAQRCQSCGGCLLICPTCSCFYVVDKNINSRSGERRRSLDACYYEGITRMAGGYNPVQPKETMMQRKFYHKLWQQVDEFGQSGCTGCGRCSEICPGNVNWLEAIKKI